LPEKNLCEQTILDSSVYVGQGNNNVFAMFEDPESIAGSTHCGKRVTIADAQKCILQERKGRKQHEDKNVSGCANNAIVDRTRSLQNDDRAYFD